MNAFFRWLRRFQFQVMLLLSAMPVLLAALCLHAPSVLPASYVLFAAFAASSGVCLLADGRRRLPVACAASALLGLAAFALLPLRSQPLLLLLPAALIALLFFSLPLAARRYESDVPPFVYVAGIAIHVVMQFLHHYFEKTSGASPYQPAETALTLSLIGYLVLLLLSMNRISLDNASQVRHRIPDGMRLLNTSMTLGFILLSMLLALTPAVIEGITRLWQALSSGIVRFLSFLISLLPAAEMTGGMGGGAPSMMMLPEGEMPATSPFAKLLEKIATVITLFLIVAGFFALIYLLWRLLSKLIRRLLAQMRQYMTAVNAEYEDEITDTRADNAQREIHLLSRRRAPVQEAARTPKGRIRQGYARLLRRRSQWSISSTARENLPEEAAALYERARYSDHPITPEDADRFSSQIKNV